MSEQEFFNDEEPEATPAEVEVEPAPKAKKQKRGKKAKGRPVYDAEVEFDAAYKRHMHVRGMIGPYPTEEPDDPATLWSPRPGIFGSKNRGYKKIR